MTASTAIDPTVALDALRALESGREQAGEQFDWNPDFIHGYAARDVASALPKCTTWRQAYAALEQLAAEGRVVRVKVAHPQRDAELQALEARYGMDPDHVVAVFRSVGA